MASAKRTIDHDVALDGIDGLTARTIAQQVDFG